jgi:lipoprotein-anchoring transpeptidase ErfK/SrfK
MRPRWRRLALLLSTAPLMVTVGCAGGSGGATPRAGGDQSGALVRVTVAPGDGAEGVRPDSRVTVSVADGRISQVQIVDGEGEKVPGAVDAGGAQWTSSGTLDVDTTYTVTVIAADDRGKSTTTRTSFATVDPPASKQLKASTIAPLDGTTVGVAQPLVVGFNHPVKDRAAAQAALHVATTPEVDGAWYWIDDQYVHYRPKNFWPAGTKVTLHADIRGVDVGDGMWGVANRTRSFTIARKQLIRVDVKRHRLSLERNGKAVRSFPVSTGKKGWETRNGIKVIMEKVRHKKWTNEAIQAPEEYTLFSDFALRMTNSGEFIHDASWNTGNIGSANTSHGCVGMYPKDMAWVFRQTITGDPVIVSGSPRKYTEIWNRYMDWNVPWRQWSAGNA